MKLAIFSTEFPPGPGGIGTHAFELARNLMSHGWRTAVVASQDYCSAEEVAAFNRSQPFEIDRMNRIGWAPFEAFYRLAMGLRHVRRFRPDLLLATGERAARLVWAISRITGIPWVAVGHGGEFGDPSKVAHAFVTWTYSPALAVICVSEYTRRFMERRGIRARNVLVIPNGADDQRFGVVPPHEFEAVVRRLGLSASSRFLLTVGNVCDRKGQELVIRAMPQVLKRFPETHYLMVGLPTIEDRLKAVARDLQVLDHVHFLGRLDGETVLHLMNAADVFAMTSRHTPEGDFEGFGIAVVEAALCATPSVVTGGSGLSEAIADGETGFVVPEGDVGALAETLMRLLGDESLRRRMGDAARQRALREQTWDCRAAEYDRTLRALMKGSPVRPEPHVKEMALKNARTSNGRS
jgi:phosphatidylinositol alpha-1,6-mannosyltransferase